MRVTTQGEYGLRCLARLAANKGDKPISVSTLAGEEDLSRDYVEQLLLRLRRAGIVRSTRGVQGGYKLSRKPEDVGVGDVIRALEGKIFEIPCKRRPGGCAKKQDQTLLPLWSDLERRIAEYLDGMSLAEVIEMVSRELGHPCCE
ncbi:MAG: Rrf2 family transcriptional regulator [Deltaproteobacteria bacterium]|nr:Rrf2 family transcriptional regulator [Deltaproteobacteria bacterium]